MMKGTILHTPKNISFAKRIVKYLPQATRSRLPAEISIVPVSAKKSAALNRIYRNKRAPANVLSFLYGKEYGEIIVCPVVIRREAKKQDHSYRYQLAWMIVHGMIHLSGVHHEKFAAIAHRAERLEKQILNKLGSV